MSKIKESLNRLFQKHRIIVWYDEKESFRTEWEELQMEGVNKREIQNNGFATKHELYILKPEEKFLLYLPFARPNMEENWLLDVELSNYLFHTDQEAMVLQELELPVSLRNWLRPHLDFFNAKERIQKFKQLKQEGDDEEELSMRLIQAVLGADSISLEELISRYAELFNLNKSDEAEKELNRFGLSSILWNKIEQFYEYKSGSHRIYDLLLELFQKSFAPLSKKAGINAQARVLVSKWKDQKRFDDTFRALSRRVQRDLRIEDLLMPLSLEEFVKEDTFESVDRQVIRELANLIMEDSINSDKLEKAVKKRETGFWWEDYRPFYRALERALRLIEDVKRFSNIEISDYDDGFKQYASSWYTVDQHYRLFIQYYREVNHTGVLQSLYKWIHKIYSNTWLVKLSNRWQEVIDKSKGWYEGPRSQSGFFERDVKKRYLEKGNSKLFVIISDAFRYECGSFLNERLNEENRFTSSLEYQVTNLPSYTQLGMASLLPHKSLSFGEKGVVLADGKSTLGSDNREKILQVNSGYRATVISAEKLMRLSSKGEEARQLVQENDLVYVYHNAIDNAGDDVKSEEKVIDAAKEEIVYLMDVVKKIANMNGTHMIVTSDHGFIYQHEMLQESDFTDAEVKGEIDYDSRRFLIGQDLTHNWSTIKFNARDLNISSDREVVLPKGMNRMRKQGSGSRYVHGGMTLQETVVPVLFISKRRVDTVAKVDVDILNKNSNRLTTNIHTVKFYQMQPVNEGYIARSVKVYFAVIEEDKKTVISDLYTYTFNLENERNEEREVQHRFTLSTSLRRSNSVYLIIEEKVDKSDKWVEMSRYPYMLSLLMESDFEDF